MQEDDSPSASSDGWETASDGSAEGMRLELSSSSSAVSGDGFAVHDALLPFDSDDDDDLDVAFPAAVAGEPFGYLGEREVAPASHDPVRPGQLLAVPLLALGSTVLPGERLPLRIPPTLSRAALISMVGPALGLPLTATLVEVCLLMIGYVYVSS
jgi:hypothetical protein